MSNVQRIKIPRMPDRSVVECFKKLGDKYGVTNIAVSAMAFSHVLFALRVLVFHITVAVNTHLSKSHQFLMKFF